MNSTDIKLKERVKELKCLYDLSKIAWEADNDLNAILTKTLAILPQAMQYPDLAEVCIVVNETRYATKGFSKCHQPMTTALGMGKKKYGTIQIGYRAPLKSKKAKYVFLAEENNLVRIVARELSLFVKRAAIEEDKQKLEMQLQHSERLAFVGELSAGIAHELNEPLGRILGFAQLIQKTGALDEQNGSDIERIIKASLYTREIIKKLMIFSRQMPRQINAVNLNAIVSNILYFIDIRFQSRGIKIVKKLDPHLPLIQADEVQMSQVLVNLITNAIHSLTHGGQITVTTKRKKDHVGLTVKDTGTGMLPEVRKKIFEPFYSTKPVGQGTGLGLSVVLGIVEDHKGKILVSSTVGKGSKFEVLLPLKQNGK
ncbi:sensor histidine kinase [Chryseolinea lacunae]|uniref:histidine kinase n=1 Tax=Chryseolinea lacunae TaxID=2801331 RepID=A0ABS1KMY8_9BACT|nr:ATP-binding protein [Chryseolinea lacunae]MBL0740705.1 GHKL domain-containing protein [Chryseolinea lacunae]